MTHFVAVDGEGITVNGVHSYVLLSVGTESLHHNGAPLSWSDIWTFLWEQFQKDDTATFVGFYLGYDFTQWLRTLPDERASMLLTAQGRAVRSRTKNKNPTPFPVRYEGWEFDMLPHRRFKLRPQEGDNPWLYVCDAGAFFQSSFLTAIDPTHWRTPIVSDAELALIIAGKEQRANAAFGPDMITYNVTENVVMQRLMSSLHAGMTEIGVSLKRSQYFGPGQAASEWLKTTQCIDREEYARTTPKPVRAAAIASYYGGWFEIRRHGRVSGTSYQYDINSAYPHIIAKLPCLKHGRWLRRLHGAPDSTYVLVQTEMQGSSTFGPAPYRNERGAILRPQSVKGWYWKHEIEAAYAAGLIDTHRIIQSWSYTPCDCEPPLAKVAELYEVRRRIGKDTSTGQSCKLVYNSIYGKFAQSAGMPRWANPVYASLITAGCRAQILTAIGAHPERANGVCMVATDSVLFTSPHPHLAISDRLGEWSEKPMCNVTLFAPGVYWDDAARTRIRDGKSVTLKSRGVTGADIATMVNYADYAFDTWTPEQEWPSVQVPIRFDMISCEQALAWHKWNLAGTIRKDTVRTLSSESLPKRATPRIAGHTHGMLRDERSWYSLPWPVGVFPDESIPYARSFGETIEDWGETPDGDVQSLFREALLGV